MFSNADRERVRDRLIEWARADPDIAAAALVGSTVPGGDRWSDLDLTFGVAPGVPIEPVLTRWTRDVTAELGAVALFDLTVPATVYRVFLLPGALQVDLSFAPAAASRRSPRFRLLFGKAVERPAPPPWRPRRPSLLPPRSAAPTSRWGPGEVGAFGAIPRTSGGPSQFG